MSGHGGSSIAGAKYNRLPRRGSSRSASRSRTDETVDSLCQQNDVPECRAHILEAVFVMYIRRNIRVLLATYNAVPYDDVVDSLGKDRKATCTVSMHYEVARTIL